MNKPKRYERIFWIEIDKIKPNPMQPREDFDDSRLQDLADSIRQYGVLQPLLVTRKEIETNRGTDVEYELISGERRLRASQLAGLSQVPIIIHDETEDKIKLELAIIENLQREDLNSIERAKAFKKLADEFKLRHHEIAEKIGKSREYVTNTVRLLLLPEEMQIALINNEISEGHCRPLLMLSERKEEQIQLFQDIVNKKINVRMAEKISRTIAIERARKKDIEPVMEVDQEIKLLEQRLMDTLGTKVQIEQNGAKRKIQIEFPTNDDLQMFLNRLGGSR